ncbi:MAG: hypothetical protein H6711_34110 [Myxococcales bacterium]|nr:hypothetical protein [Myxococcales bacterium]
MDLPQAPPAELDVGHAAIALLEFLAFLDPDGVSLSLLRHDLSVSIERLGDVEVVSIERLGDAKPEGCKGKIDFLFVISRAHVMKYGQEKLIAAFPQFIETIEAKFADFDFHIMAVDGDPQWGLDTCTDDCPLLQSKVGDGTCPVGACPGCEPPINFGDPCCSVENYPCNLLDSVTVCDETIGAGNVFAAGAEAPNKPCKMPAPERRYLVSGDPGIPETFACMAQVGTSGHGALGEAMTRALYPELNAPGGCNAGFLRDDALLMVTFIGSYDYDSKGDPASWAGTVLGVKGDPGAVVFLEIFHPECPQPADRICEFIKMFPYHMVGDSDAADYAPIFDEATDLVETACAEYVPR